MSKIIIIGAGVSGLCSGSFLQKKGFETTIFESGKRAGGLMTYWKRENYVIENCIHWFVGSGKNNAMYPLWNQVMDMESIEFSNAEVYGTFKNEMGESIRFFTNVEKLEAELLYKAPEDSEEIKRFCAAINAFKKFKMPLDYGDTKLNFVNGIKFFVQNFKLLGEFNKWSKIDEEEYSLKFKNPFLREVIKNLFMPEMAMAFILFSLAWMDKKEAGYPIGGSKKIAEKLETRYVELGGKVHYKSAVKRILVENNKAIGVELENGDKHFSEIVISACDAMQTLDTFLEGKHTDQFYKNKFSTLKVFPSYLQVSIGIQKLFPNLDHSYSIKLPTKIEIDPGNSVDTLFLRVFNNDSTLAPTGSTLVTAFLPTYNFDYWYRLKIDNLDEYSQQKSRILNTTIQHIQDFLGSIEDLINMKDISTPSSVFKYTRNYKGSMEGWVMTKKEGFISFPNKLKGLNNFYMVGQWVSPGGGLPSGLMTGHDVSNEIAKKYSK